jgi:hypothetical protein
VCGGYVRRSLTREEEKKKPSEQETGSSAQRDDVLNYYCPATEYKTFKFISSLIAASRKSLIRKVDKIGRTLYFVMTIIDR